MKKFKFVSFLFLMIMLLGIICSCDEEHTHKWNEITKTTATCTEDGKITYLCDGCEETKVVVIEKTTGHTEVIDEAILPTCTETGLTEGKHCSKCEEVLIEQKVVSLLGHKESKEIVENNILPTCTEDGYYDLVVYCSECNEELSRQNITVKALGHDIITHQGKEPTCTANGYKSYETCTRCEYTTYEEIKSTDHTYSTELSKDETGHWYECNCKGRKDFSAHISSGEATEEADEICTVCGYVIAPKLNHEHVYNVKVENEDTLKEEATCTENAIYYYSCRCNEISTELTYVKEDSALGHTPFDAVKENEVESTCKVIGSYDSVVYCSVCEIEISREEKTLPLANHTEEVVVGKTATCIETGLTEGKKCSVCNEVLVVQEEISVLGHDYKWVIDKEATVLEAGLKHEKCTRCDSLRNENTVIDILICSHNLQKIEAIDATCIKDGNIEYYHCLECLKYYSDITGNLLIEENSWIIEAKGHIEVIDDAVESTCTTKGKTEGKHCSVCNEVLVEQEEVEVLNHDYKIVEAVEPKCEEDGNIEYYECKNECGKLFIKNGDEYKEITDVVVEAKGHTEVIDEAVASTCTAKGKTEGKHCSVCNKVLVKQEEVAKLPHSEYVSVSGIAPTCETTGWTDTIACSECGVIIKNTQLMVALGHEYENNQCTICKHSIIPSEGLEFILLSTGYYAVAGIGTCTDKNIIIPANYNGKKVVSILECAFYDARIDGVYIPSSVSSIGDEAFYLSSVGVVYMEEGIKIVGKEAFSAISSSLDLMVIPSTLTSIGREAFLSTIKCVVIDSQYVASNATSYDSVGYLLNLSSSVLIRSGLSKGSYVTNGRTSSNSVNFNGNAYTMYSQQHTHLYEQFDLFGQKVLRCSSIYCHGIIDFKGQVYDISATEDDNVEASIYQENDDIILKLSGSGNFTKKWLSYSPAITKIIIEEGITAIPENAFTDTKVKEIIIPSTVTNIAYNAFEYCSDLANFIVNENNEYYQSIDGIIYSKDGLSLCIYPTSREDKKFYIPEGVTTISEGAFYCVNNLEEISIAKTVTKIEPYAFYYLQDVKTYYIPNTVNYINNFAISGNNLMILCEAPSKPENWEARWALTYYIIYWGVEAVGNTDGINWLETETEVVITNYTGDNSNLIIPNIINDKEVKKIEKYAFSDCDSLVNVEIPNTITTIGDYAFNNCSKLEYVVIPNSVITLGEYVFKGTNYPRICIEHVEKPSGWKTYWIGSAVVDVWNFSEKYIDSKGFVYALLNDNTAAVIGYNGTDTDINIPTKANNYPVTLIEEYAFYGKRLSTLEVANTIETIETYAFFGCQLENAVIPLSVTTIENYAFDSNLKLNLFLEHASCPSGYERAWKDTSSKVYYGYTGSEIIYSFVTNNDIIISSISSKYSIKLPSDLEKTGYYFVGWSLNENLSGTIYKDRYFSSSDVKLYAVWYTAEQYFNGSSIDRPKTIIEGKISLSGDSGMYFKFVAQSSKTYTIYSSGSDDSYGSIYDEDGKLITSDDDSGSGYNFKINVYLEAGKTYILYCSSDEDSYSVYFS